MTTCALTGWDEWNQSTEDEQAEEYVEVEITDILPLPCFFFSAKLENKSPLSSLKICTLLLL